MGPSIRKAAESRPSIILTGARQVGKSTLLRKLFPEADYVTFDSLLDLASAREAPEAFLARFHGQVILDEVQYVPELFPALKMRIDEDRDRRGTFILTGSQRFELMKRLSESLAGRIAVLHLESLSARELGRNPSIDRAALSSIPIRGGYPELWKDQALDSRAWFEDYFRTYLERDLREIVRVRDLVEFRRFLGIAAARACNLINYADLGLSAGVSSNTVKTWIAALEASGIVYILPPWHSSAEQRLVKLPKLYFADSGLLAALLDIRTEADLRSGGFERQVWENFVFTELVKSGSRVPGRDLFFYRDHAGAEVDFVLSGTGGFILVEAKRSERIRGERLSFDKAEVGLGGRMLGRRVAAPTGRGTALPMDGFEIYDPRHGE